MKGYHEKLLEVGERAIRAAARTPGTTLDRDLAAVAQHDAAWLLGHMGDAGQALIEAGIPDDGRTLAERVRALAKLAESWKALAQSRARGMRAADLDQELHPASGVPEVAALRALGVPERDLGR